MTEPVIHRVTTLDLAVEPWSWPFADERRAEIDAHFALKQREKPGMWNGRVLLGRDPVSGEQRSLTAGQLEVAVLDRARPRRKFRRLTGAALGRALGEPDSEPDSGAGTGDEAISPPTALAGGSHEPPGPAATDSTDSGDADPA